MDRQYSDKKDPLLFKDGTLLCCNNNNNNAIGRCTTSTNNESTIVWSSSTSSTTNTSQSYPQRQQQQQQQPAVVVKLHNDGNNDQFDSIIRQQQHTIYYNNDDEQRQYQQQDHCHHDYYNLFHNNNHNDSNNNTNNNNIVIAAYLIRDAIIVDRDDHDDVVVQDHNIDYYNNYCNNNNNNNINSTQNCCKNDTSNDNNTINNNATIIILCKQLIRNYNRLIQQLFHYSGLLLVILTFIEPPSWCRCRSFNNNCDPNNNMNCNTMFATKGIVANVDNDNGNDNNNNNNNQVSQYYPNTNSVILTVSQAQYIEMILLSILSIVILIRIGNNEMNIKRYLLLRPSYNKLQKGRIIQLISLIVMCIGSILERINGNSAFIQFHPYLRLFFLISILQYCHRDCHVLINMIPNVFNILFLLLMITIFYAWFGVVMFVDTDHGDLYFPNLIEGLWTLWICVSTANFHDVMMPSYNNNRWVAIYFISFMIISYFFLMNVILASVVSEYDIALDKQIQSNKDKSTMYLKQAYKLLAKEKTTTTQIQYKDDNYNNNEHLQEQKYNCSNNNSNNKSSISTSIDRSTVMSLFSILNENFFPTNNEFKRLTDDESKLLFDILDRDSSSDISECEFMEFGNALLELEKAKEYNNNNTLFVQYYFPQIYNSYCWQHFCTLIRASQLENAIDFIIFLNAIVVAIQSWPELSNETVVLDSTYWDGRINTTWEIAETIFTFIYAVEVICKILVFGWKEYKDEIRNVFDFAVTILAVISTVFVYCHNEYNDSRLIRMILTARVLRLIRLLSAWPSFQLIGGISAKILPAAKSVITVLLIVMYFFAALGMHLYGGLVTRDPSNPLAYLILDSDYANSEYWANNFNDMIGGMNVLFNLLVVNNCSISVSGYEAVTQSKWVRIYFVAFHIIGGVLVNNLVIAFVINRFLKQLFIFRKRLSSEVADDDG